MLNYKTILAAGGPYVVALGIVQQLGYWGSFGINVVEFVGVVDLAKLAISSLALLFVFLPFYALVGEMFRPLRNARLQQISWLQRVVAYASTAALMAGALAAFFWAPLPWGPLVVCGLFAITGVTLNGYAWVNSAIPEDGLRNLVLLLIFVGPSTAYGWGFIDAYRAVNFRDANLVDVERSKLPLQHELGKPVVYLGLLGTTYVMRETLTGQTILIRQGDAPLVLKKRSRPR